MNKKLLLSMSLALGTVLLVGPTMFTSASEGGHGNGMMNMMNGNGMDQMMEVMNSPEGEEMIKACNNAMSSVNENE